MWGSLIPAYFWEVHSCHKQMRTQRTGVIFPTGVSQRNSHFPSSPSKACGVLEVAGVWGSARDERLWGILADQRINREVLSCWLTALGEGWGPHGEEKPSSSEGCPALFPGHLAPHPVHLCHNYQQAREFQITIFTLQNLILNSNCSEKREFLIFLGTWGTVSALQVNVQVLTSLALRFQNNKTENKMMQTHSVSFRPTSFPQPLSEMSGLAPQGTRSWGNGVRTEGAEQPERDWEGGLREWMRLWEQSREGSQPSTSLPLWWPLSPSIPSLLLPR